MLRLALYPFSGYYAYMEASTGSEGDETTLTSPQLSPSEEGACLTFWYHMYGANIGSLVVERTVS